MRCISNLRAGCRPSDGVPDMTVISDIDENGINENLHVRYGRDQIYVSVIVPNYGYLAFESK